ncbi:hypothetical protein [Desertivirga xinjiangensis]|uniref:hypothetical protein n=1 Tax=Desertivirga xinjiangensis TaxID=539206 RepID=UPI00210A7769|nr:hypothetical protein [Pedobacter xinjiangensis]
MKRKLLLGLGLVLNIGYSQAQWVNNTSWVYDFGTTPGTYQATASGTNFSYSNATTAGFLPKPSNGEVRVLIGGGTGTEGSFMLNENNSLTMNQPISSITKFGAYGISNATDLVKADFKIKFNTDLSSGTYIWAIGHDENNLFKSANSIYRSSNELFATLRWTFAAAAGITLAYRVGSDASTTTTWTNINNTTFQKGSTYQVEVYCNNTGEEKTYLRGASSYTLPNNTYNIWVDGVKLGANYPRSLEVSGADNTLTANPSIAFSNGTALNATVIHSSSAASNGSAVLSELSLIYDGSSLPISLTSFTGLKTNNGVELRWKTGSEQNNDFFEILRSVNGKEYTSIGIVKGKGDSDETRSYNFKDAYPVSGINYYRLKQVDKDGSDEIFMNTVAINYDLEKSRFSVYANAQKITVSAYAHKPGIATLIISDMQGRKLIERKVSLVSEHNALSFDAAGISPGVLVAQLITEEAKQVLKFVK